MQGRSEPDHLRSESRSVVGMIDAGGFWETALECRAERVHDQGRRLAGADRPAIDPAAEGAQHSRPVYPTSRRSTSNDISVPESTRVESMEHPVYEIIGRTRPRRSSLRVEVGADACEIRQEAHGGFAFAHASHRRTRSISCKPGGFVVLSARLPPTWERPWADGDRDRGLVPKD